MKLERLPHDPGVVLDFFEESLSTLGSLCERTWHDRLELVAEGRAAALWNPDGALYTGELHFTPADVTGARDAAREVFPGCPLTFRLAETLRPVPLPLERVVLASDNATARPPDVAVAEKLWHGQFPNSSHWRLRSAFQRAWHFSLVALSRCEIQAIDQHWSLHRVALSLPGGAVDDSLARELTFGQPVETAPAAVNWPPPDPGQWHRLLTRALELELNHELSGILHRQEHSLRRELERIDQYFANYELELGTRARRTAKEGVKIKSAERLAAAKAEHARRRADQVARHEIRVIPHLDALLLTAETAWTAEIQVERNHQPQNLQARLVPRARRWEI